MAMNMVRKKKYVFIYEGKLISVGMRTNNIMPRGCAITATTSTDVQRSHGTALMTNCMLQACVKIVTSTATTRRRDLLGMLGFQINLRSIMKRRMSNLKMGTLTMD